MSQVIPTIRVKPWGKDQGEFVEINAEDFDPAVHQMLDDEATVVPAAPVYDPRPDPFDHDGDGAPGGSLPKAKRARKRRARK